MEKEVLSKDHSVCLLKLAVDTGNLTLGSMKSLVGHGPTRESLSCGMICKHVLFFYCQKLKLIFKYLRNCKKQTMSISLHCASAIVFIKKRMVISAYFMHVIFGEASRSLIGTQISTCQQWKADSFPNL